MSTLQNKKVALGFFEAILSGDNESAASMLTDDCEFFFAGDLPLSGRHPAAGGLAIWGSITAAIEGEATFNFGFVTAEEDRVAIEAESFGSSGDVKFNNQYHFLVRVRDGKICQLKEYFDTLHVWEIVNPMFEGMPRAARASNLDEISGSIRR
ncbi:nuclear transport factor 2 family protein [Mycobacterium hubeiense]|uniref:nuclear transport factor 2 family protein n=1 Tax=Mycobacterium hubeiense TaxID=1867256 RepID=UPI000C7E9281|nr:nuclear transport factor 2 family protein [Mycobacterium sp. QGD 101]